MKQFYTCDFYPPNYLENFLLINTSITKKVVKYINNKKCNKFDSIKMYEEIDLYKSAWFDRVKWYKPPLANFCTFGNVMEIMKHRNISLLFSQI